jgi:hypothetical protein
MSDDEARRRSARRNLTALAAVALFPFAGSFLLYYFWTPGSYVNYGELLQPVPVAETAGPEGLQALRGKWAFVMVDGAGCDDYCRRKLYVMRQVRLTQGKDMERVERAWLVDDDGQPPPELMREYDGTRLVAARGNALIPRIAGSGNARDHLFIMDPLGNVILRYPRDADPSRVKKDLSRLLRASRIG